MKKDKIIRNEAPMNTFNLSSTHLLIHSSTHPPLSPRTHPLTNSSTHPPNTPIIQVKHLSKRYQIGMDRTYKTFCETAVDTLKSPLKRLKSFSRQEEVFWALKDINFEVNPGEIVGIIGKNGAGKTTLLKVLSQITHPTEGEVTLRGRVGSLLEVGTGFHPELTGRENIYFNGSILGMTKSEIEAKFDEIVKFAEVEKFLDTPVKRYSSGMSVRLAFAVAAHLESEILLVDEVLAVGDVAFQKKCIRKMENVTQDSRTVLLVSHNMGIISTICEKAILLTEGRIKLVGPAQEVVSVYLASLGQDANLKKEWAFAEAPSGENAKIKSVTVTDHQGIEKLHFSCTEPIFVTVGYWILKENIPVNIYLELYDEKDNCICVVGNHNETRSKQINKSGLYMSKCTIPGYFLNSGKYNISVGVVRNITELDVRLPMCVGFETVDDQRVHSSYTKWAGLVKPEFKWQSERLGTRIA